jgi:hypothetical protein
MKYQVTVKTQNSTEEFITDVDAKSEWSATSVAMADFLKTRKLSGELVMYKVKDQSGNLLISQF